MFVSSNEIEFNFSFIASKEDLIKVESFLELRD